MKTLPSSYVEAPNELPHDIGNGEILFLAGGITGLEDWQSHATEFLKKLPIVICNPRRKKFEMFKNEAGYAESKKQIEWEYTHLKIATQILFWFGKETVQPIALFELGGRLRGNQTIFLGAHPEYPRRFDLTIQAPLYGYLDPIVDNLNDLLRLVVNYNSRLLMKIPVRD